MQALPIYERVRHARKFLAASSDVFDETGAGGTTSYGKLKEQVDEIVTRAFNQQQNAYTEQVPTRTTLSLTHTHPCEG